MDIMKKYVQKMLSESVVKHEEDFQMPEVPTADASVDAGVDMNMDINEDSSWNFNPFDEGMSGSMTHTYSKPVHIVREGIHDSAADVMDGDLGLLEPGRDDVETVFLILYADGNEDAYGYQYSVYDKDWNESMVYDYADSIEELRQKLESDFLPYVDLNVEDIPFEEFESLISAKGESEESCANVRQCIIDLVENDADLLTHYMSKYFEQDALNAFADFIKKEKEIESAEVQAVTDEIFAEESKHENRVEHYMFRLQTDAERSAVRNLDRLSDIIEKDGYFYVAFSRETNSAGELAQYLRDNKIFPQDIIGIEDPKKDPILRKKLSIEESTEKNEASKVYTFHINCEAAIVVNADSEDYAKEILARNNIIELDNVEFAGGDAELREISFESSSIDDADADSEFDPEEI